MFWSRLNSSPLHNRFHLSILLLRSYSSTVGRNKVSIQGFGKGGKPPREKEKKKPWKGGYIYIKHGWQIPKTEDVVDLSCFVYIQGVTFRWI